MTDTASKPCTTCARCTKLPAGFICTLPPECFDLDQEQRERLDSGDSEWIGADCDRARKMGEMCGPRGALWSPRA